MQKNEQLDPEKHPPQLESEKRRAQELGDQLYEKHGKPLESEHWGKYLAVHPDGRTILEDRYQVLAERANTELGKGIYVYRIGPRAIHKAPSLRLTTEVEPQAVRRGPSSLIRRIVDD